VLGTLSDALQGASVNATGQCRQIVALPFHFCGGQRLKASRPARLVFKHF